MTNTVKNEIIKKVTKYINSDINVKAYGLKKMLGWENFREDINMRLVE